MRKILWFYKSDLTENFGICTLHSQVFYGHFIDKTAVADLFADQINYFLGLYQPKMFLLISKQLSKLSNITFSRSFPHIKAHKNYMYAPRTFIFPSMVFHRYKIPDRCCLSCRGITRIHRSPSRPRPFHKANSRSH